MTIKIINDDLKCHACDLCDYKSDRKGNLNRHKALIHGIGVIWYKCGEKCDDGSVCEKECKQTSDLKQHKANIHNIGVTLHYCGEKDEYGRDCGYNCKKKSHLTRHLSNVHDIGPLTCEYCCNNVSKLHKHTDKYATSSICRKCFHKATGYKTRIEKEIVEHLISEIDFPLLKKDQTVQGEACQKYRPDAMWASHERVIHFECDENQHSGVSYSCDEKRISDLYDEYPGKSVVWIRWNPDGYKPEPGFEKKTKKQRFSMLVDEINNVFTSELDTMISVIYMFYSYGNANVSRNIKHTMIY